ncbi:uncharacterized protein JCM10292_001076 [Rhodotorula paludigena]|uniref:uncharacterized protein n=1 Tax=Rhodotorula paludigena TaxID=86838 RepID=UPI00317C795C
MGLFLRRKQREPASPPGPPPGSARTASAPPATTLNASRAPAEELGRSYGSSTSAQTAYGGLDSPDLAPPGDRYRVFGGSGGRAGSSTLSLPAFGLSGRDGSSPRQRQASAMSMAPVEEHPPAAQDKGRWSRWKLGRGSRQRQASISSTVDGKGLGIDGGAGADDGSGFVVRSFRTVSRVHEDPVPLGALHSAPASRIHSRPSYDAYDSTSAHQQQESLRNSLDCGSQNGPYAPRQHPRRPSLATLGNSSSSASVWERAPSPTISAEAFRLASARNKSSVSLASLADANDATSPTDQPSRSRFEPQRPASRTSRRGSSFSDLGASSSPLVPPRPSFAIGQHSNSSNSSVHSRTSSSASLASPGLQTNGLPAPSPSESSPASARSRPGYGLTNSESLFSVTSYTTAPELRTAASTPQPSAAASERPAPHRLSSGDSDLRLIASYGDMLTQSPPVASPVDAPFEPPSAARARDLSTPRKSSTGTTGRASVLSATPSFAIQPPTPQTTPGFSDTGATIPRPKRTSSLAQDSVKSALQSMGVGPGAPTQLNKGKGKAPVKRGGWASDTSDDDAAGSDDGATESDSDDEVPLAQIRSRSQTDLTLPMSQRGSFDAGARPAVLPSSSSRPNLDAQRRPSNEVEVLRDPNSPTTQTFAAQQHQQGSRGRQSQSQLGVSPLGRRGSNRRSVSTLSFSTSMTISQAATAAVAVSGASGSPATPVTAPSSPTRSILRPAYASRSVSNPTTPTLPSFAPSASLPASGAATPALSPVPSPLFATPEARDRSSASSGSGTASTSSAPHTPNENSPSVSDLGLVLPPAIPPTSLSKPSVKFDLGAGLPSQTDVSRANKGRRLSAIASSSSTNLHSHRSSPSLPMLGPVVSHQPHQPQRASMLAGPPASHARTGSTLAPVAPPPASKLHMRASSATSALGGDGPPSSSSSTAVDDNVYDRMKARHKAEALAALKIGRDLNHPSGLVPDAAAGRGDSDEDEPLANLPTRGSVLGGYEGSMMSGMGGGMHPHMAMGMGGAYSPLAMAPPGVDPYLYASLPPDQKMSLHQRAGQMMAMMQQAALQARAESVAGSVIGAQDDASIRSGAKGHLHGSASLGSLNSFMGAGGYGHAQQPSMASMHLPPFAPTYAMSQPFLHPAQYAPAPQHAFYGMPAYAGSALGFPTAPMSTLGGGAPGSMMGVPASGGAPVMRANGYRASSHMSAVPRRP